MSDEEKNAFTDVESNVLARVRTMVIHEYVGVEYDMIWKSMQQDIPLLKTKLELILPTLGEEGTLY